MTIAVVVLAVALVGALLGCGLLWRSLLAARAETDRLHAEIARRESVRPPRPVKAAGRVLQTAVETATRVRERGVSGMLLATAQDFTRWITEDRGEIARLAGPDGTITVFFSDIEGSTRLNNELGDEDWVKLLGVHDTIVEKYVDRFHGHVVKQQGDGYMVVFPTPADGLRAALDIQGALGRQRHPRLRRTPVKVRMGLHTGTVVERNGDFFGQNVALAARIAAHAQGGEILVSDEVVELADDGFTFEPFGKVELKGFESAQQLWRAEGRGPSTRQPAPASDT